MINTNEKLKELGFDKWFLETIDSEHLENFELARVVAVHKDSYTISSGEAVVLAELVGKIAYSASSPVDYPAVGIMCLFAISSRLLASFS